MLESLPQNPMFYAAALAALLGVLGYYLYYESFIKENYRKLNWFRRIFLPHITLLIHWADENTDEDLPHLYVETTATEDEKILEVDVSAEDHEVLLDECESALKGLHFRPEVILASLATTQDGYKEIGNWVLTAPKKKHPDSRRLGIMYDLLTLLFSKYQLHVRIFYDEADETLEFYTHFEHNAYNPLVARKHFHEPSDTDEGKDLFVNIVYPELRAKVLDDYDHRTVPEWE